jgi:hypothetical protein
MDHEEKRKGTKPVPDEPLEYLNEAQRFTYHRMKASGWRIKFIRRPMFQNPVCVMTDPDDTTLAVIERNGFLNRRPDIPLRNNESW